MAKLNRIAVVMLNSLARDVARDDEGLSAMEYFVMMVGLIAVIFTIAQFMGVHLLHYVTSWMNSIFP